MSMLSRKQPKKKSLKLLEKLVQDNSSEEGAEEREALLDSLIKENGGNRFYEKMNGSYSKKGKTKAGKEAENERQSRSRTKDQHESILYAKKPPTGQGSISVPSGHVKNGKSRSRSRSSSRSSSSSFWSDGSKSRSRSRSPKRGTPRTPRRKSNSSSRSRSHSRSRSRSRSKSRSRSRSKSSSPHSYVHGVHTQLNLKNSSKPRDTMSEQGHRQGKKNQQGRRTKLLNRSPLRKFRSMDISPDVFIEERLNQKYRELHELVQTSFSDRRPQVTREYFNQIQSLRDSYTKVSHGMQPSGILLPGTGMLSDIKPPGVPQRRRPMSASTHAELRDLTMEDGTYYTIRNVMTASTARQQQKVRTDINGEGFSKKKKKKKRSDQKRKDSGSTIESTVQHNGYHDNPPSNRTPSSSKATGSPRSKEPVEPTDHHIKHSNNPTLLSWLKQKDVYHRKQKREERQKKKEERQKLILEANEKFEKRLDSQKLVEKWMKRKQKESRVRSREERIRENMRTKERIHQENVNTLTVPGKPLRPQSAPPSKKGDHSGKEEGSQQEGVAVSPQVSRLKEEELKQANAMGMEPHPPASKFIYKRPVAGRIKLNMRERPKSASVITPQRNASASPGRVSARDSSNENKQRMSYEDWLQRKRKDEVKQKKEIQLQKEELAKSDPELAKIIPEIAKKRIHRVLEGKKSIDTGIEDFDNRANKSFGGADFQDEDASGGEEKSPRASYRLDSDRISQTDPKNTSGNLKLSGQSLNMDSRPGTAPARGRVPTPKRSSNSPRKAVAPPKDKRSDEVSAGFSLPFQEKDGVPSHVASTQRKLFAEKVWEKLEDEERPEPQGCAATETPQHLPHPQGGTNSAETDNSTKGDNTTKGDNSNTAVGDNKDNKDGAGRKVEEEKEEIVGDFFLTSREDILDDMKTENDSKESEQKVETPAEEDKIVGESSMKEDVKNSRENEAKTEEVSSEVKPPINDLETDSGDFTSGGETQNGQTDHKEVKDSVDEDSHPEIDDTESELHFNTDDLRPESANTSRSLKHVSFREEAEVFGKDEPEGEEVDWSTDTATPDVDDYAGMARDDLNVEDKETEEQAPEEETEEQAPEEETEEQAPEEVKSQVSRTSLAESMEEDF